MWSEHMASVAVVFTSVVPLSLMPYLSLVFLILSDVLLMNFFISYNWETKDKRQNAY